MIGWITDIRNGLIGYARLSCNFSGLMILALPVFIWIYGTVTGMYFAELVACCIAGAEW
jgi:hypothetical protein